MPFFFVFSGDFRSNRTRIDVVIVALIFIVHLCVAWNAYSFGAMCKSAFFLADEFSVFLFIGTVYTDQ